MDLILSVLVWFFTQVGGKFKFHQLLNGVISTPDGRLILPNEGTLSRRPITLGCRSTGVGFMNVVFIISRCVMLRFHEK